MTSTSSTADAWDGMYQSTPPWDTGHPQAALVRVAESGGLRGRVLDVGCGTGEHVLLAASFGLDATGIDLSVTAVRAAEAKAAARGITGARFAVGDVLDAADREALGGPFDTVTDCGVFHVFSDEDRPAYVAAVRALLATGGRYVMCVFSDEEPPGWGPRRISRDEIREALAEGWRVESIEPIVLEVTIEPWQVRCWLTIAEAT